MTIPAKYTLTEAHFIIAELEREVKRLRHDVKEREAIESNWKRLYEREKGYTQELKDDLRDFTNDEIETDRAMREAIRKRDAWRETAARKGKLLLEAYPYVESALMASANMGFHVSAQVFLDRYRKEIGK